MVVEAALDDDGAHARRAQVVPISIGYEKVIEEKSYAKEAAGGEKKKEDVKGLLKATRVLGAQYGRLNIQFDDPLPLGETLREYGALAAWDEEANVVVAAEEAQWKQATQRLAYRIVYGIDRVTAVTPTALAACALLATGKRGIVRARAVASARFLMERARANGGRLSAALVRRRSGELDVEALDRAIELLGARRRPRGALDGGSGAFDVKSGRPLDEIYTVPEERRPRLAYYRNNAIHLFVADGLVALALARRGPARPGRRRGAARAHAQAVAPAQARVQLSRRRDVRRHLRLRRWRGSSRRGSSPRPRTACIRRRAPCRELGLLAGQVTDFVESYYVAARGLETLTSPTSDKDLVRRIQDLGEKMFFTGEVRRREACVRANYANAMAYFKERGLIVEKDKKLTLAAGADARRTAAEIADLLPPAP